MAALKTRPSEATVEASPAAVEDDARRLDCLTLVRIMKQATKAEPWFLTGFSPGQRGSTLYSLPGSTDYAEHLRKLGPCKTGKSCPYIRRLADVDRSVLKTLVRDSVEHLRPVTAGPGAGGRMTS